jgi:3D (Asp-Asp-Asp) domain-containing protein
VIPVFRAALAGVVALGFAGCATAGSTWIGAPMTEKEDDAVSPEAVAPSSSGAEGDPSRFRTRVIGGDEEAPALRAERVHGEELQGRVLGTFRNTYYDFPLETDFGGAPVALRDGHCGVVSEVPRGFFEAVCVQGSGILKNGRPVSFEKRDCDCAETCPKTGQKICFEPLDRERFPWGRGALGTAITPLLTIAVDDTLVPMGTAVYIPEFDGLPIDRGKTAFHDGCFIAQDRGLRVKGTHVDVFTGQAAITDLWNHLVPSNRGVTVVVDSPRCSRARVDTSSLGPERSSERSDRPARRSR